jgi:hypothetical protein
MITIGAKGQTRERKMTAIFEAPFFAKVGLGRHEDSQRQA